MVGVATGDALLDSIAERWGLRLRENNASAFIGLQLVRCLRRRR